MPRQLGTILAVDDGIVRLGRRVASAVLDPRRWWALARKASASARSHPVEEEQNEGWIRAGRTSRPEGRTWPHQATTDVPLRAPGLMLDVTSGIAANEFLRTNTAATSLPAVKVGVSGQDKPPL